jgi:hypothetical protein
MMARKSREAEPIVQAAYVAGIVTGLTRADVAPAAWGRQCRRDAERAGWSAVLAAGRPCWQSLPGDRAFAHVTAGEGARGARSASRRGDPTNGNPPLPPFKREGRQASENVSTFASTVFQSRRE